MKVAKRDVQKLISLLNQVEIPINYNRARVKTERHGSKTPAGKGRSVMLGNVPFAKNKPSNFTQQHPEIYKELELLAKKYVPFAVQHFMLNKNYQTQPHYDGMNSGKSVIFSFGDYAGGELVVEGNVVDTYLKTYEMDGRRQLHWNNPILSGTKYSIVFFN